jgi:hypothetical protein
MTPKRVFVRSVIERHLQPAVNTNGWRALISADCRLVDR